MSVALRRRFPSQLENTMIALVEFAPLRSIPRELWRTRKEPLPHAKCRTSARPFPTASIYAGAEAHRGRLRAKSAERRRKAPKGTERPTSPSTSCQSLASQASGPPRTIGDSQSAGQATTTRNNKTTTKGTNNQCRRWETWTGSGKNEDPHSGSRVHTFTHTRARTHIRRRTHTLD